MIWILGNVIRLQILNNFLYSECTDFSFEEFPQHVTFWDVHASCILPIQ